MKISFDLNISLDKDKKTETEIVAAKETTAKESSVESAESASKAIASSSEETTPTQRKEPEKAAETAAEPAQNNAEITEEEAPSKLDKAISVAKDGKELYDSGKEALELVSSIKTRGIIAGACIVLTILLIIFTPIFCHYWPQYQLKNRAEDAAAEVRDKALEVMEDGKNLAAEKKGELAPKFNETKEQLGVKIDNAKAQAAESLDNAEKALDSKLDSAKKWLKGDDTPQADAPAESAK